MSHFKELNGKFISEFQNQKYPFMIWLLAVVAVLVLNHQSTYISEGTGVAMEKRVSISPEEPGILSKVAISMFDRVKKGDIVAILDDTQIQSELLTARADLDRLKTEVYAEVERLTHEKAAYTQTFFSDEYEMTKDLELLKLKALNIRSELEPDRIHLKQIDMEARSKQRLFNEGLISELTYKKEDEKYNALLKKIQENEKFLLETEKSISKSSARIQKYNKRNKKSEFKQDDQLLALKSKIKVQEYIIEELELKRTHLFLKSPIDGVIVEINKTQGEVILSGSPIMTVVNAEPDEIIAFAALGKILKVKKGENVTITSVNSRQKIKGTVSKTGVSFMELPDILKQKTQPSALGRPFIIKLPKNNGLAPGEVVTISTS